jgi:hypothetical protein
MAKIPAIVNKRLVLNFFLAMTLSTVDDYLLF